MTKNTENVPPNVSKRSIIVPIDEESELSSPSKQQELGSNRKKPRQLLNTDSRWHILGRDCSSRFGTDDEGCAQLHPPNRNFCQTDDFVQPAKFSEIREGNIEECLTEKRRNTQTGPMREVSRKPSSPGKVRELILSKRRVSSLPPLPTSAPSCEIEEAQSVFEFKNVGFVVGKGNKQKDVLTNITHTMKSGELLAMMGPSGAGKTSLLNVLTLDADYGTASGTVLLDKQPMDDSLFRRHCFIVKQQDKHWDYLTARETLVFAGKLFEVAQSEDDVRMIIEETIDALGLGNCADTKCFRLSGGEKRRLSLAVALLKTPQVLFLDEPTSGLDSASALAVANEISRAAKEAKMIIICVIHQPSTRVFSAFDQVMILSRGRQAYTGNVEDALSYFHNIGYPLPYATNPAEHFLDLVNADFSDEDEVQRILLIWQDHVSRMKNSKIEHVLSSETQNEGDGANKIVVNQDEKKSHSSSSELDSFDSNNVPKNEESSSRLASTFNKQLNMMLRRQFKLAKRDPLYYLGRCGAYLATGLFFSLVYWHARPYVQSQAINKVRVTLWLSGVPAITSVVAVYSTGMEFNLIQLETKNGMVKPLSFVLAREILTLPIMIVFAMFAMGIPGFVIQDFPPSAFGTVILLWATMMYAYESLAAALGIWCGTDPILGMLVYTMVWFITYLFSGAPLEIESMYWPFKACYYLNHLTYYIRSIIYVICTESTWETCDMSTSNGSDASAICVPNDPPNGEHILDALGLFFGGISSENTVLKDFVVMLSIAFSYKIIYVCGVIVKTHNSAKMGGKDIIKVA